MICAACGAENESTHKFCFECGTELAAVCPNCGHGNPPAHKFCSECGTTLGEAAAPAAGVTRSKATEVVTTEERRLVTALFADLVGFTPFSENRDPEEVRAMLTTYFDRSREIIERFGGVVDKFIGDAVTAFWGATRAEEDDAERAVRAALELVDAVSKMGGEIGVPDLALRAGVLTGETSVGPGGNEKGLVVGDVVNTASRLQSIADPGTVAVGESTYRLTEAAVAYQEIGEQQLKGKSLSVPAWRAVRVVAERGGSGRHEGLEPPFVGRQEELRLFKDQVHAAQRESRARLISVIGEGGIGKSRLLWEFQKYIDGLVEDIYWHQGRSPAYGEGLTFWALGEMVRRRAGIAETDDEHRSRTRLRTTVAEYVTDVEEQHWIEPRLAGLLGLDEMPSGDRAELFSALRTFFQRIAERGTTVLVFEDLHWGDSGLMEFVKELVERSPRHPILVVTLSRPELLDREPGWGSGHRSSMSLHLGPLSDQEMHDLVTGVVPGIPDQTVATIVEQAAGVPLYGVEMVRMLVTEGDLVLTDGVYQLVGDVTELAIPDTLSSVIGARLDRLDPDDRSLIQDASVLGQSFVLEGLAALRGEDPADLESRLTTLLRKELLELENDPRSPERGQYRFIQSLIREVAYSRLTKPERAAKHVQVAEYYETLDDPEMAALIASHFVDAYRATSDEARAAELVEKARTALTRAAERAASLHADSQALLLCERALEITEEGVERAAIWQLAAQAADSLALGEQAIDYATKAYEWAADNGEREEVVRTATHLATMLTNHERSDDAIDLMEPLVEDDDDSPEHTALLGALSRSYMLAGHYEKAATSADQALLIAEHAEDMPVLIDTLITRGSALLYLGRPREGQALLEGAVKLADDWDQPRSALRGRNNAEISLGLEDPQAAFEYQKQTLDHAKRIGDQYFVYRFTGSLASSLIRDGLYEEALALWDELGEEDLPELTQAFKDLQRASIEWARDGTPIQEAAEEPIRVWEETQEPQMVALMSAIRAENAWRDGEAEKAYELAMSINDPDPPVPWHLMRGGFVALWLHDAARARAVLERLRDVPHRGRVISSWRETIEAGIAALDGRTEESVERFRAVLRTVDQIGMIDDRNSVRAIFARTVGLDHPEAAQAAANLQQWIEETGSAGVAQMYSDILPTQVAATAS